MTDFLDNSPYDERLEKIEIESLLEALFKRYGYDFRNYAYPSLRRRIWHRASIEQLETISLLQNLVLHDRDAFERLLSDLVIPVTEMFRDPGLFQILRARVMPILKEASFIRVWHAGCATGEEAYSMAILLDEIGMLNHSRIYATDISEASLQRARQGLISQERMSLYAHNYEQSGGKAPFASFYETNHGQAMLHARYLERIVFAEHNLVTDRSFNEFQIIFCRNVMIYFDNELRERVHALLYESLSPGGFLVLGNKESVAFTSFAGRYETWNDEYRIYRKPR
ncbi:CheR family methyltransferase [Cohnella rhizosphaerae]|uniref:Protein-glutamate O-methyltransferase CheR n=1 Tax=Cohnella rhizosphaerae TaxID=1457232 RepID=A0A9X4KU67_9BACL|nr:protein-glutamate O-methyltransferase CheR [Cohnella rhizosphaerae]MDG0810843.1 protein-glutamate O-methyltransferase CheR [Cohnella rhizosphaerae]